MTKKVFPGLTRGIQIEADGTIKCLDRLVLQNMDDEETVMLELQNSAGASLLEVRGNADLIIMQQVFS